MSAGRIGFQGDLSILDRVPGRPRLLNAEREAVILEAIAKHGKHYLAARQAGISPATLNVWIRRGLTYAQRLADGGDAEDSEEQFFGFVKKVAKAQADFEAACLSDMVAVGRIHEATAEKVTSVTKGGTRKDDGTIEGGETTVTRVAERKTEADWRALAYVLEHVNPDEYKLADRTELSGPDGEPIETQGTLTVRDETGERLRRIYEALGDVRRGSEPGRELGPGGPEGDRDVDCDAAVDDVQPPHTNNKTNGVPPPQ